MKKSLKKLILPLAVCMVIVAVIGICIGYFHFISEQIGKDSRRHLEEIYGQVNRSFYGFIEKNWGLLESCEDYLDLTGKTVSESETETVIAGFIKEKKEFWGFSDFYFLDRERNYITIDGQKDSMKSENSSLDALIEQNAPIMMSDNPGGNGEVVMFATAIPEGIFKDFAYSAIAISYTNTDVASALNANAFNGTAKCFIIDDEGDVLLSTEDGNGAYSNYLRYLGAFGLSQDGQKQIRDNLKNKQAGYLQCELNGDQHCIIYMPVGYKNFSLLSDVPQSAVSEGFIVAQNATLRVLLIIFSLIVVTLIAALIVHIFSQSRKNKTELKYRERMFDVLSSNVNDIFLMLDPQTESVNYVSPNIKRLLGIEVKEARENIRIMAKCAVDYNIIIPNEELRAIPTDGSRSWECEYMHQATGERRWYRVTIYHTDLMDMKKYIIVMSDRTLDRQLNRQLEEALTAAKSANEAKSNFLSNMSHDIRTPMNAIVGFSVLLEKNSDDQTKVSEYTHKIMASSHHLLSLINDVLDMSKIESGKTSLNVARFSLPELLEELKIILMPQAQAKGQELTIKIQGNPPEQMIGDKLRLNQILINLLSNAIKYTPNGGKIWFNVSELPNPAQQFVSLRFVVKDNGIGMSEEFQKEVFKPFSREKNSVINQIQGTGLGMAITKNLVDLMGGVIEVESKLGEGSKFTVDLSFSLAEPEETDSWFRQKITRMLVADDEEEICLNIKEMMRDTGVDVQWVTDGAAAVDKAVSAHENGMDFHVILLDWKMPGYDGVQTARQIREKVGKSVPILVLTSYDWSEIEAEARQAGINAFMPKPFFVSTFWQTIKPLFFENQINKTDSDEYPDNVLEGKFFLVAEDNELNADILTELLHIDGADCEVVENGEKAVEAFENSEPGRYNMILMDVQMPVMNGYEATKAIRASSHPDAKTIPIIAMTANTFAEDVKNALDAGMNAHLGKPINMEAVRQTVRQLSGENKNNQ